MSGHHRGAANNGIGVAGVDWTAKMMPVKVLAADGCGTTSDVAEGIDWAADHGAKVINLSLGGPGENRVLHDAVMYAVGKGVVVVAPRATRQRAVPVPGVVPRSDRGRATNASGALTSFSSYGDWVDIAAPGTDIVSTGLRSMIRPATSRTVRHRHLVLRADRLGRGCVGEARRRR